MLLFWPIGIALGNAGTLRFLRATVAAGILVALAVLTMQRATLWGNAPRQAQVWAAINPDSARAQTSAALYDLQSDRPRLAAARLRLAMPMHPDDLQIPVNLITAECRLGAVHPDTLAAARTALANDRVGGEVAFNWFGNALASVDRHACRGLDYATLQGMLDAAWHNPYWREHAGLRQNLLHLEGTLDLAQHRQRDALQKFDLALKTDPNASTALSQAATLGAAGYPRLGLAHLDYFATLPPRPKPGLGMPRVHAWVLREQGWWQKETSYLRKNLEADAAARAKPDNPHSASLAR
jgi:tetratricopeptide (TPR) repeat protein